MSAPAKDAARKIVGFPFPQRTVTVRPRFGTMKVERIRAPGLARQQPEFRHMGQVETQGHRAVGGRYIRPRGVMGKRPSKASDYRFGHRLIGWTHPYDRVEQWWIDKEDKVRITVGKDRDMFNDAAEGKSSGYKIYTVEKIDQERNRVYLKDYLPGKPRQPAFKPKEWDTWDQEKKKLWSRYNEMYLKPSKSVQLSNVSLLVQENKEDPSKHIWAKRMKTSTAKWNAETEKWEWSRYATAVTGTLDQDASGEEEDGQSRNRVRWQQTKQGLKIEWPLNKDTPNKTPTEMETKEVAVQRPSYAPVTMDELESYNVENLIPSTPGAGGPKDYSVADAYINNQSSSSGGDDSRSTSAHIIDALMPLYISEELSPRFSDYRRLSHYKMRVAQKEVEKQRYIEDEVTFWKYMGRDRYLRETMDLPEANLRGVPLKPRTKREVEEAAALEWASENKRKTEEVALMFKKGMLWDYEAGEWKKGPKAIHRDAKWEAKKSKVDQQAKWLANLKLSPAKNMVVPLEARKGYVPRNIIRQLTTVQDVGPDGKIIKGVVRDAGGETKFVEGPTS